MADRIGQQLDKYRITRLLGRGGFADVYLGEHIYLKTPAAIKILQTRLSGSDDLESFLKEARFIAQLSHPHIVRVLDFGVHEETPFLVMEYAPNGTLRERHPSGTLLPLPTVIPSVKQVADALQYAHSEKLVHRDIKPENMLVGRRNDILLSDFGIALIAQSSRYQSTQDVTGTIAYMSPEQIQGKPRPASDQYALGIVVYEWLCGDRPFHGSFTELCAQHMFASPPPLHEKISTISQDVEHVVMTALAKDPKQRFGSVQAFANALEQASQAVPKVIIAPSPSPQPTPPLSIKTPLPTPIQDKPTPSPAPTQYEPPPPLVPTQLESVSFLPETGSHPPSGNSSQARPVTQPVQERQRQTIGSPVVQPTSQKPTEKVNVWSIDRPQKGAMLVSVVLAIILGWFFGWYDANYNLNTVVAIVFLGIAEVICLFLGAVFGPWVGLFTTGVGVFIGGYIATNVYQNIQGSSFSFGGYITSIWLLELIAASIGFIAGLAFLLTKGRYNDRRAIITAEGFSIIGIVVIVSAASLIGAHGYYSYVLSEILQILLYTLPGLVLLPILLFTYDKIIHRKKA